MLAEDSAVEQVVFGSRTQDGVLASLPKGATHISCSTISVRLSRRLAEAHAAAGQTYVSAPVFGRPEAAAAQKLWVVAAGAPDVLDRCAPVFDAVGQGTFRVGDDPATANSVKLAGNFTIAAMLETLGEAFAFVRKSGVAPDLFLQILNGALYKSPIYGNYGQLIADERFEPAGFALRLGLKDVRLALEAAEAVTTPMPLASLLHDHLLTQVACGRGSADWSAIAEVSARNAGLGSGREVNEDVESESAREAIRNRSGHWPLPTQSEFSLPYAPDPRLRSVALLVLAARAACRSRLQSGVGRRRAPARGRRVRPAP